jgi:hypothetical protein
VVKLDLVGSEDRESFFEVGHQLLDLPSLHHEVVDIHLKVPIDLLLETLLHAPLEGCLCGPQAEEHQYIAEGAEGG